MQLSAYVEAIVEDLRRIARIGDADTNHAAELLAVALESSLTRRLQEALGEAALELTPQLENGHVELRIAGADPQLVHVAAGEPSPPEALDEAFDARITLRLPGSLKSRLEAAATAAGLSLNSWVVQALTRTLESRPAAGGLRHRLTGYGRT